VKCEEAEWNQRHHGWFVGYAPREKPEIVVAAIGEHVCKSSKAAAMVKEVIEAYFDKYPLKGAPGERDLASGKGDS